MSETKTDYRAETEPTNGKLSRITCEPDRVQATIVIAIKRDGKKIAEQPFNPTMLFDPFDLEPALKTAVEETQKAWEQRVDL
ncbi:MAG TPA: hypothetical protein VIM84_05250 [Gemmatimonadales bacterium]